MVFKTTVDTTVHNCMDKKKQTFVNIPFFVFLVVNFSPLHCIANK